MQVIKTQGRISGRKPPYQRAQILLVDENLRDLEHYRRMLQDCGFNVEACANFAEAAHLLEVAKFDCIVTSQGGPTFQCRIVLEHAVARDRYRPVVIVSRHHDIACYLEAMQLGAVDYLEKPLSVLEIKRAVTTHLQLHHAAA